MELDDLKNDWEIATNQVNKQTVLTPNIIHQMTQKKYQSKIKKIKYPEIVGGVICYIGLIFIGINFHKLDTLFLQSTGVLAISILLLLPILSFLSLAQFYSIHNVNSHTLKY